MKKYKMIVTNLREDEVKEVLEKVREIEQRHPKEIFMVWIEGSEKVMTSQEALEFLQNVFPKESERKVFYRV